MKYDVEVIVIDDDEYIQTAISELLYDNNIMAKTFGDPIEALEHLHITPSNYSAIVCDVRMENMTGFGLLEKVKALSPELPVILITAYGDIDTVIKALRQGAYDFIQKPIEEEQLLASVKRAVEKHILLQKNINLSENITEKTTYIKTLERSLERKAQSESSFDSMIGKSQEIKNVYRMIQEISQTDVNILITGESGTGKELVARSIHNHSNRKNAVFLPVNCGAIPHNLIESELFGYEVGAFTGAMKRSTGKFEHANRGTIFLDEISELPLPLQVKILRFLQDKIIIRLGSNIAKELDVRIISASNKDLETLIHKNKFREDLYYRLNVINIHLPPLRERKDDIILLSHTFIKEFNDIYDKNITNISEELYDFLINNPWIGNIRELKNTIERGVVLEKTDTLQYQSCFYNIKKAEQPDKITTIENFSLKSYLEHHEKELIENVLNSTNNDLNQAAEKLKVTLRTLYRKIGKYAIKID